MANRHRPAQDRRGGFRCERFAAVALPLIPPRVLAAPPHPHHREDEYSIVLEGTLGVQLGEAAMRRGPGTWIVKPRKQWHTFGNPADVPCRTIEIVSPAGFERVPVRKWPPPGRIWSGWSVSTRSMGSTWTSTAFGLVRPLRAEIPTTRTRSVRTSLRRFVAPRHRLCRSRRSVSRRWGWRTWTSTARPGRSRAASPA